MEFPQTGQMRHQHGQRLVALGQEWPIAIAGLDAGGALAFIPNNLWLIEGDYVELELGNLGVVQAMVEAAEMDWVKLEFSHPMHAGEIAAIGYSDTLASKGQMSLRAA